MITPLEVLSYIISILIIVIAIILGSTNWAMYGFFLGCILLQLNCFIVLKKLRAKEYDLSINPEAFLSFKKQNNYSKLSTMINGSISAWVWPSYSLVSGLFSIVVGGILDSQKEKHSGMRDDNITYIAVVNFFIPFQIIFGLSIIVQFWIQNKIGFNINPSTLIKVILTAQSLVAIAFLVHLSVKRNFEKNFSQSALNPFIFFIIFGLISITIASFTFLQASLIIEGKEPNFGIEGIFTSIKEMIDRVKFIEIQRIFLKSESMNEFINSIWESLSSAKILDWISVILITLILSAFWRSIRTTLLYKRDDEDKILRTHAYLKTGLTTKAISEFDSIERPEKFPMDAARISLIFKRNEDYWKFFLLERENKKNEIVGMVSVQDAFLSVLSVHFLQYKCSMSHASEISEYFFQKTASMEGYFEIWRIYGICEKITLAEIISLYPQNKNLQKLNEIFQSTNDIFEENFDFIDVLDNDFRPSIMLIMAAIFMTSLPEETPDRRKQVFKIATDKLFERYIHIINTEALSTGIEITMLDKTFTAINVYKHVFSDDPTSIEAVKVKVMECISTMPQGDKIIKSLNW